MENHKGDCEKGTRGKPQGVNPKRGQKEKWNTIKGEGECFCKAWNLLQIYSLTLALDDDGTWLQPPQDSSTSGGWHEQVWRDLGVVNMLVEAIQCLSAGNKPARRISVASKNLLESKDKTSIRLRTFRGQIKRW